MFEKHKENLSVPIYARKLNKQEIILKRDQKSNWGRFLDNHYNQDLHTKSFGVSMNGPKHHYKYSKSGLSHNYKTVKILEKLTVEDQNERQVQPRNFKEVDLIQEDEIYVFIEYWSNSERTQISTRHIEEKYESFAKRFRQGILEKYPFIKVYLKSHSEDDKIVKYKLYDGLDSNIIENQRTTIRIGAFELSIAYKLRNFTKVELLFSKLKSKMWPSLPIWLQKISQFLPKTSLIISLFDSENSDNKNEIEGMKVNLRLSFKESHANEELRDDINNIHGKRINGAIKTRESLLKKRRHETFQRYRVVNNRKDHIQSVDRLSQCTVPRPISAQTRFSTSFHKNLLSMVKQNNDFRQKSGVRAFSALTSKTGRPQTAATNKTHNRMSTLDQRTVKSSYSMTTLQTNKRKRKRGVKVEDIEFTAEVNQNHVVIFTDIPKAVYRIEAAETPFFKYSTREVNLYNEADNAGSCTVYLPLDRQETKCTSIYFPKTQENSKDFDPESEEPQYIEELEVKALLLQKHSNEDEAEGDEEIEYEEEFYFDKRAHWFRSTLVSGLYMLIARGDGFTELNQFLEVNEANTTEKIILEPKFRHEAFISTHDARSGEPLGGVMLRWRKKKSRHSTEGLTEKEGMFWFAYDENTTYIIEAEKKGFINYRREIVKVSNGVNDKLHRVCMLPVELPPNHNKSVAPGQEDVQPMTRFRMVQSIDSQGLDLNFEAKGKVCSDEEAKDKQIDQTEYSVVSNTNFENEFNKVKVERFDQYSGHYLEIETNIEQWMRFSMVTSGYQQTSVDKMDKHFKSDLEAKNLWVMVFTDNRQVGCMYPSSLNIHGLVWDIGLFNPVMKKFIQTNSFSVQLIERDTFTKYFFKFFKYLNLQNEYYNFSLIFGFNEGMFKFDDYHITERQFIDRMKMLDIQWISEKVTDDKELQIHLNTLDLFFVHLANGCKNVFGEVCLKKVVEKFEPHLAASSPQKNLKHGRTMKLGPTTKLTLK